MKNKTHLLILLFILLVIPTSSVFACGNSSEKNKTETSSCSKDDIHSEKKSCCESDKKDGDGCGGNCGHASCHCPTSVNTTVLFNEFRLKTNTNFKLLNNDWAYVQHVPKAVHLSIWQPPKIS